MVTIPDGYDHCEDGGLQFLMVATIERMGFQFLMVETIVRMEGYNS